MNAVVFEHVKVDELPQAWRANFAQSAATRVTVRIEEEIGAEPVATAAEGFSTDDPAFGIWRDRDDMNDVAAHVERLRAPRFDRNGSRDKA
ncbi:hypothetical protein BH11PSE9_BH11PSE9_18990 [soil metagenome]